MKNPSVRIYVNEMRIIESRLKLKQDIISKF